MSRREAARWWTTRRWLTQSITWIVLHAGLLALVVWVLPAVMAQAPGAGEVTEEVRDLARQFPELIAAVVAVGVVLVTQGTILDERRNGVLEWLLSKPLARPALVLGKFIGQLSGLLATAVAAPWVAVLVLLSVADGQLWPVGRLLGAAGLLALVVAFHLSLVLLLSVASDNRAVVLAVPLVAIVGADPLVAAVPDLFHVLPWSLGALASVLLADGMLITPWPVLATVLWTGVLLLVGALLFHRAEL